MEMTQIDLDALNLAEGGHDTAARDAARAALKPTVEQLQDSAIDLFARMTTAEENAK